MNKTPPKFAPPKVIAVDVDGTLHIRGEPNLRLIEWIRLKKSEGFFLMLWSSRGESNARKYAELFGVTDLFDLICSKPGWIVDDKGWRWTQYTRIVSHVLQDQDNQPDIDQA